MRDTFIHARQLRAGSRVLSAGDLSRSFFVGLTLFDFQRLRNNKGIQGAPLLAASISLDILDVFLFFLPLFGGDAYSQGP